MCFPRWLLVGVLCSLTLAGATYADERLEGVACRSVHLWYPAEEGTAFYNEVTVGTSAPGSYFMVCGWSNGYYGLQQLGDGKKLLLFSVWDSGQNDPNAVAQKRRVRLVAKDKQARIGRFGGEGTGGQAFYDYDWKPGQTYRLLVSARPREERTDYTGWFYEPEVKAWKPWITFSAPTRSPRLRGYYSFVEDFKRDKDSATRPRRCHFGNGWIQSAEGKWIPLAKARFTADRNPAANIDAGTLEGRFFLATGGDVRNANVKLGGTAELPANEKGSPRDLPELRLTDDRAKSEKR